MVAGSRVTPVHSIAMFHLLMFSAVLICNVNASPAERGGRQPNGISTDVEDAVSSLGGVPKRRVRDVLNRCHSREKLKREDHSRFPRNTRGLDTISSTQEQDDGGLGRALYFTTDSDLLLYKRISDAGFSFPRQRFTMEMWVKPEGGQSSPAVIAELSDKCKASNIVWGWSVYIDVPSPWSMGGAEFKFSLQTDRSIENTTVRSHRPYQPNTWLHVAVSYDGWMMRLYLDGAMVGAAIGQRGDVFSMVSQRCKEFSLGGSRVHWAPFRGAIGNLRISDEVLSHATIKASASAPGRVSGPEFVISEDFDSELVNWSPSEMREPEKVVFDAQRHPSYPHVDTPKCGLTVCDNPEVARSYINNPHLRSPVVLRFRPIVLAEDDGSNPTVSSADLRMQHRFLSEAYGGYNITWHDVGVTVVRNSSLRRRFVIAGCDHQIGNRRCDLECKYEITGYDGGDCDEVRTDCPDDLKGDGVCQPECNKAYHDWDDGDCCIPTNTTFPTSCADPSSLYRSYISAEELKAAVNLTNSDALNVFFVDFVDVDIEGFATMPWEVTSHSVQGGVVIQGGARLTNNSLIHEMGHALGLLHVHHGVSEMSCTDECYEHDASLESGDLVEDTNPTPTNHHCRDPTPAESRDGTMCGGEEQWRMFIDTPFRNFMSYSDSSCTSHFTPHQAARMHCYIDLMYPSWDPSPTPGTISLPPRIMEESPEGGVTIAWLPPLSGNHDENESRCAECTPENAFVQYASGATSTKRGRLAQVTGPPDAKQCSVNQQGWMAFASGSATCNDCLLNLEFEHHVVPARLSIWVSYIHRSRDVIRDVILWYDDSTKESLGPVSVDCDIPFTTRIFTDKLLVSITLDVSGLYTIIDAVQVVSRPQAPACQACTPHRYRVLRDPPFESDDEVDDVVDNTWFEDRWIEEEVEYSYRIKAISGELGGLPSPMAKYQRGDAFCGNRRVERYADMSEECDDGNHIDGDGCDKLCHLERFFICEGEPSRCRRFIGDGVCEEFERTNSELDCGFYTPPGYTDQWASSASANPIYQALIALLHHSSGNQDKAGLLGFQKPVIATSVVVHIAGVSFFDFDESHPRISVELLDPTGLSRIQQTDFIPVSCDPNQISFDIKHDLSMPFVYTQFIKIRLSTPQIAISGIRLRSYDYLKPVALSVCGGNQVFNPKLGQCMNYECNRPVAEKPSIRNANVTCTGLEDGDTCEVQCMPGYRPTKPIMLQNIAGSWEGPSIMCKAVDCGMPPLDSSLAIASCPTGTRFGSECSFKCIPPAKLQGTDNTLRCEEDGLFSLAQSFCQVLCDAPPTPPNAMLQSQDCRSDGHNVGSTCKFRCKAGFTSAYKKGRPSRVARYQCSENATWIGYGCEQVTCPAPSLLYHDLYNCTNAFNYKSQCTLYCPGQNAVPSTITCTKDGEWDQEFTPCDPLISCPEPVPPPDVIIECPQGQLAGAMCKAKCRLGRTYQIAMEGATYRERGLLGRHDVILCTAGGVWYPNLDLTVCHEKCLEYFIGDNECERRNNRAYCLWDGGACCPSTAPTGEVITFPENCGEGCECRDPDAIENIRRSNGSVRQHNRPPA
ncbi:pappalysin-1-like [Lytechinus variegatus]|uniref:pappalysin-1-like n=1 Tax=Lytechinus variegatus TaxID=7654 RepID=UPI001BB2C36A|nr:pappalysin-1-like [Lytechinus variegatus]